MDFENRKRIKKKQTANVGSETNRRRLRRFSLGSFFFVENFTEATEFQSEAPIKRRQWPKKKINQSAFLWGATLIGVHETHLSANWRQINLKFLFFLVFFFFFFFFFIIFFVFFFAPYAKSGATHLDNNSNNSNNNSNNNNSNNNNSNNLVSVEDEQETRRNFDSSTKWNSMKWRQIVNNR